MIDNGLYQAMDFGRHHLDARALYSFRCSFMRPRSLLSFSPIRSILNSYLETRTLNDRQSPTNEPRAPYRRYRPEANSLERLSPILSGKLNFTQ
jgi:hypothetical protein